VYRIAPRGEHVLLQHPDRVDLSVLSQFEEPTRMKASSTYPHPNERRRSTSIRRTGCYGRPSQPSCLPGEKEHRPHSSGLLVIWG
jgi:hypothetical protein